MKRRSFLTGAMSLPVVAAVGVLTFPAISPALATFTPNPAMALGDSGWLMVEREVLQREGGGRGASKRPFKVEFRYYAIHAKHRHAIDLAEYGNVIPEDAVLDAVTRTDAYVNLELDYRVKQVEWKRNFLARCAKWKREREDVVLDAVVLCGDPLCV